MRRGRLAQALHIVIQDEVWTAWHFRLHRTRLAGQRPATESGIMRVVEVNSIDGLPGLRLAWRSLLSETPGASFHQSCEWMEAIFRHQQPTSRLRVLLVTGGGETVGILPLVQTERSTPLASLRVVGYPNDRWSPFQGPIGPHPTATLMAGLRHLSNSEQDWDVLELRDVDRASANYARTRTSLEVAEMSFQETDLSPRLLIDLQKQPNDFIASRRLAQCEPNASNEHRRSSRDRLTFERHRPRGTMYDDANPRWDLFERCLELPRDNRQPHDVTKKFLRDIHVAACRSGAADMNVLRHGNEILACCYNVHIAGVLIGVFGGSILGSQSPYCADRTAMQPLVSKMLQDSMAKHDVRWLPAVEFSCPAWPSTSLRRSRFVHHRQRSASRLMRRVASCFPRLATP